MTEAWVSSTLYRGMETIAQGRPPEDMIYLMQRICGFCPVSHAMASALALQDAAPVEVPKNGQLLRNMMHAADYLMDHIRHFYFLLFPDFVRLPEVPPFVPYPTGDYRLPKRENDLLVQHYLDALDIQRRSETMVAVFGGKSPHVHGIFPGGASLAPTADRVLRFRAHAQELLEFIESHLIPDLEIIARYYSDYRRIGRGHGNLISYGLYQMSHRAEDRVFRPGVVLDGRVEPLDLSTLRSGIEEDITHSWFQQADEVKRPLDFANLPARKKEGAYTWVKAPRYRGRAMETGPLARLWVMGEYREGVSMLDRVIARVLETKKMAELCIQWSMDLEPGRPHITPWSPPREAEGAGLVDAVRGALGHWIRIENHKVARYQVVTPTTWNNSPRDARGQRGAMEEALIGTPVEDPERPIEVVRVIHSFDPCNACAVQVITPDRPLLRFRVL
ncbi:MAG: nickel-dependent hydrogenase large subunit [Bacillota bacterium]|nr:nickel-dependent hydrogenase large subunit [Bacillota bacterium]